MTVCPLCHRAVLLVRCGQLVCPNPLCVEPDPDPIIRRRHVEDDEQLPLAA